MNESRVGAPDDLARSLRLWLRLRVLFNGRRLDRELADGQVPSDSEERCLRAEQLSEAQSRSSLAASLREVVADAEHPGGGSSSALPIRRAAARAARSRLLALAERLDRADRSDICGIARSRALLADGAGPLYSRHAALTLDEALAWVEDGFAS
jgi:hypothetical protein